MKVLKS